MKRLYDVLISIMILLMLMPVLVIIAIIIGWKFGSPIIFKQQRPGYQGKPFTLYKFRTMQDVYNANNDLLPDTDRITSFGKFLRSTSLDELPELLNIIKGDMSLVGPRPLLMEYMPLYNKEQARRHKVKPGITGWAQVNGRNALCWEDKFQLDVWYVDNCSFILDLKILWLTIFSVLKREGISQKDHVSMAPFKGSDI